MNKSRKLVINLLVNQVINSLAAFYVSVLSAQNTCLQEIVGVIEMSLCAVTTQHWTSQHSAHEQSCTTAKKDREERFKGQAYTMSLLPCSSCH